MRYLPVGESGDKLVEKRFKAVPGEIGGVEGWQSYVVESELLALSYLSATSLMA